MKSFFKDYWELCFIISLIYLAPYIVELSKEKKLENDFSEKEDEKCQL